MYSKLMVAFGHTAIGAIVGYYAFQQLGDGNPATGLIITGTAGLLSHYIMDTVPHGHFFKGGEYKQKILPVILFDLGLSILLYLTTAFYFSGGNILFTLIILFGIGGSQLPDILDGLIYIGKIKNKGLIELENRFHISTHWHGKHNNVLLWSIWDIWQVGFFFLGLYLLLNNKI